METRLTLRPGQPGTRELVERYGDRLVLDRGRVSGGSIYSWIYAGIWRYLPIDGFIYIWILSDRISCGLITS